MLVYLRPVTPEELTNIINELYYRTCIQNDTPANGELVLMDISTMQQCYANQEEYELSAVCQNMHEEISIEIDTRKANDVGDALISLLQC